MAWVRHHDNYGQGYFVDPMQGYVEPAKVNNSCCSEERRE